MRRKVFSNRNLFFPRMLAGGLTWCQLRQATVNRASHGGTGSKISQTLSLYTMFRAHVSVSIGPPPASKSREGRL